MTIVEILSEIKRNVLEGKLCWVPYKKDVSYKSDSGGILKIYPCGKKVLYGEENRCKKTHQCPAYQGFTKKGITSYKILEHAYYNP